MQFPYCTVAYAVVSLPTCFVLKELGASVPTTKFSHITSNILANMIMCKNKKQIWAESAQASQKLALAATGKEQHIRIPKFVEFQKLA